MADADARDTSMCTGDVISPSPSNLTPAVLPLRFTRPEVFKSRIVSISVSEGSSLRSSIHFCKLPTFTTSKASRRDVKPTFGRALWSGVCPPLNPGRTEPPCRAFVPLWPRPAVLPLPDPIPRPTLILGRLFEPGFGARSLSASGSVESARYGDRAVRSAAARARAKRSMVVRSRRRRVRRSARQRFCARAVERSRRKAQTTDVDVGVARRHSAPRRSRAWRESSNTGSAAGRCEASVLKDTSPALRRGVFAAEEAAQAAYRWAVTL